MPRTQRAWLLLLILLSFALRVYHLDSLPRSFSLDEATNGLDAWQLWQHRPLTPFLANNFGRETLFFYLQGLALQLYGVSFFAARFIAALSGTLAIPLIYVVGRRLYRPPLTALLAATALSGAYWPLYFSRVGLRAMLLLPLLLSMVYFFWRGWYSRHRPWLILASALLGLSFYSYLAARLLPVLLIAFLTTELLSTRKLRAPDLLSLLLPAMLMALPLSLYFWQHPTSLTSRTAAISILATPNPWQTALENSNAILRLHLLGGSWLGQWPALSPLLTLGLLIGLPRTLRHLRHNPAARFLLLWWLIGLIPLLLSQQNWHGETTILRSIVAWPALMLISAHGLLWLKGHLPALLPLTLLLTMPLNGYHYFSIWATEYNNFSDHPPYLARHLNQNSEHPTLVPLKFYAESVGHFLLKRRYPQLINLSTSLELTAPRYLLPHHANELPRGFALLHPTHGTAYLLPPLNATQRAWLQRHHTQTEAPQFTILDSEQEAIAHAYPLPPDAPLLRPNFPQTITATFAQNLILQHVETTPNRLNPVEPVTLRLDWRTTTPLTEEVHLFIHLFDVQTRHRWGQINQPLRGLLFDAIRWPPGLIVPGQYQFTLPDTAPAGAYRFEVGLYHPATGQRLPLNNDDKLLVGKFHVGPPPTPQQPMAVQFGPAIRLIGRDGPTRTTEGLRYTLYWQATAPPPHDYTVFNHLLNPAGELVAQLDRMPQQGQYPTSWWSTTEIIADSYTLPLPEPAPRGRYTLRIGLYNAQTGQRLPRNDHPTDFVTLPWEEGPLPSRP